MKIQFRDYRSVLRHERDKANNFNGTGLAECTSENNVTEDQPINIHDIDNGGRFYINGNYNGWTIGCQRVFAMIKYDDDGSNPEEIYVTPFDTISIYDTDDVAEGELRARIRQVHDDLIALRDAGWNPTPTDEREMNAYIKDCENDYMPDIF